jgi:hypothetical protein
MEIAQLILEAAARAERLGWRTITLKRLRRLAEGDEKALPPDPATAPRSAFGQSAYGSDCYRRERRRRQA